MVADGGPVGAAGSFAFCVTQPTVNRSAIQAMADSMVVFMVLFGIGNKQPTSGQLQFRVDFPSTGTSK